ncbi:MAG TPA: response regulator transcription factor [Thermoleophilaceae bacterium]|nr:response regulator transcription factor [Thermoleophilaceae bacterium]
MAVAAVFMVDDPTVAPSFLLVVPIALFTCALGLHAGLAAAAFALLAVIAHWETSGFDLNAGAYLTRAVAFSSIPPSIIWAKRTRSLASDDPPPGDFRRRGRVDSAVRTALGLTRRELEVLQLLALGHTNPEIADQLYISVRTVEGHRARLQRKLGRSGRAQLVSFALERDLIRSRN